MITLSDANALTKFTLSTLKSGIQHQMNTDRTYTVIARLRTGHLGGLKINEDGTRAYRNCNKGRDAHTHTHTHTLFTCLQLPLSCRLLLYYIRFRVASKGLADPCSRTRTHERPGHTPLTERAGIQLHETVTNYDTFKLNDNPN